MCSTEAVTKTETMVVASLTITRENAIVCIDGNDIVVPSRLPMVNFRNPTSTIRFLRAVARFVTRIQEFSGNISFQEITGDEYMVSKYHDLRGTT